MQLSTRRAFLSDLGRGMAFAAIGPAVLARCGIQSFPLDDEERIAFGTLEPLVAMMQDNDADDLLPKVVEKLRADVPLKSLVAAAALANTRTFGGQDYTGYHCAMALMPAWQMAGRMSDRRLAPLPVLKVLHRNTVRIRQLGGSEKEVLRRVSPAATGGDAASLVAAERRQDMEGAEAVFAAAMAKGDEFAFDALQDLVRENIDVHQVVLAWRSWDLLELTGREHAHAVLRQAMRQCVDREQGRVRQGHAEPAIRTLLPRLVQELGLEKGRKTSRSLDDAAVESLAKTLFTGTRDEAARAVAEALAEGSDTEAIGEALTLASIRLLLHDRGQSRGSEGKPVGSVHGASVGVHASDSAAAWRGIARLSGHRTKTATLIAAAWHTGGQSGGMDRENPMHASEREAVAKLPEKDLLGALGEAISGREQGRAAAIVERFGTLGQPEHPVIDLLFDHAVTDDGALHHEKFFRTAFEGFQTSRAPFRWFYLSALARVCASGRGFAAPGLAEARKLLQA